MKKVIITVTGPDRPGIIASISETLFKQGCNIENISQTCLQFQFAGICVVSVPEDLSPDDLYDVMNNELSDQRLHVHINAFEEDMKSHEQAQTEPFVVTTRGPDKKGLVARISRVIADSDINITNLTAVFKGGSNPEGNIMIYEIDVPAGTDVNRLAEGLRKKASENDLEVTIQHKNIFDAVNRI
jgi:glycine cleavage system transcriptional repressor